VVLPSNAYEAKGLLTQSIRDDDPVIFFEHKAMYDEAVEVPDDPYTIPFGEANVTREGDDVTIITMGRMVNFCNQVADKLAKEKIGCTVVDLRIPRPCWRRRRRPAVSSSSMNPTRAATWPPTSPPSSARRRSAI
jgi:pyruvate dehydrogenase E1 component beta subunit